MWDIIFDENKVWDNKSIQYNTDKIKRLDDAIEIVQVLETETEDIQLGENLEEVKLAPSIVLYQNDYEAENLDAVTDKEKKQTKNNNLA